MGMYGPGMTFGQIANLEKERIKHAFDGEKFAGEDENGNVWVSCSDEECNAEILSIFDECVFQALKAMHSGRALGLLARKYGFKDNLEEYQAALDETKMQEDYTYEEEEKVVS